MPPLARTDWCSICAYGRNDLFRIPAQKAANAGEGYAGFQSEVSAAEEPSGLANEKHTPVLPQEAEPSPARQVLAFVPLILVGVMNKCFTMWLPHWYPDGFDFAQLGLEAFGKIDLPPSLRSGQ